MTQKCSRCNAKEAVFCCVMCESFKFLCTQCDGYVHGLPSKKKHKRTALINDKENSEQNLNLNQYQNQNMQQEKNYFMGGKQHSLNSLQNSPKRKFDWDKKFDLSPKLEIET